MGLSKAENAEYLQKFCEINLRKYQPGIDDSSRLFPVCLLFSSGILRETFGNSSGAPEELPKNV
jgi:hypothetical protein